MGVEHDACRIRILATKDPGDLEFSSARVDDHPARQNPNSFLVEFSVRKMFWKFLTASCE